MPSAKERKAPSGLEKLVELQKLGGEATVLKSCFFSAHFTRAKSTGRVDLPICPSVCNPPPPQIYVQAAKQNLWNIAPLHCYKGCVWRNEPEWRLIKYAPMPICSHVQLVYSLSAKSNCILKSLYCHIEVVSVSAQIAPIQPQALRPYSCYTS